MREISLIRVTSNQHFVFLKKFLHIKCVRVFVERLSVVITVYVTLEWTPANAVVFNKAADIKFLVVENFRAVGLLAKTVAETLNAPSNPVGAAVAHLAHEKVKTIEQTSVLGI